MECDEPAQRLEALHFAGAGRAEAAQSGDGGDATMSCLACLAMVPVFRNSAFADCPACGTGMHNRDGAWALHEPDGGSFAGKKEEPHAGVLQCQACVHRRPDVLYVILYFFAWAVLSGAVYLGGVDARWLGGWWLVVGLGIFPLAFRAALKSARFITPWFPNDLWSCHARGVLTLAGSRSPRRINPKGDCQSFQASRLR